MTFIRSNRFLILGFMVFAAVFFLAAGRVMATGLIVQECTSCATLAAFQSEAYATPIPASAYNGDKMSVLFEIVNPGASLLASIGVHGFCLSTADGAPCRWNYVWTDDTNSMAELRQAFAEVAPPLAAQIPVSVASTFTGTAQAAAVNAWLAQRSSGVAIPLETVVLTTFPDGSSAEYQVIGTDPAGYGFVPDTGHAANGDLENDSGEQVNVPVYAPLTPPVTVDLNQHAWLLAQLAWSERVNTVALGAHLGELGGTAPLSSVLGLCNTNTCPGTETVFGNVSSFQFTQGTIVGSSGYP